MLVYSRIFLTILLFYSGGLLRATEIISKPAQVFQFSLSITLPGDTDQIYDAMTGDISGWWDHKFFEKSQKFYIDPAPGGGFYEIFDESGDGVRHAVVIFAQRGKILRFEGPLGLTGRAVQGVYTYQYESASSDSTRLTVDVHLAGEIDMEVAKIVEQVWHHFIFNRLRPFIETGKHFIQLQEEKK